MDQRTKGPGAGDAGARRLIPSDKRDPSTKVAEQYLDRDHEADTRGLAGCCGGWIAVKADVRQIALDALVTGESSAFSAEMDRRAVALSLGEPRRRPSMNDP